MRVLITGISGYVGRSLARVLKARGHDVVGLGRSAKGAGADEHWTFDLARDDVASLAGRKFRPTHVVHLAGVLAFNQRAGRDLFEKTNIGGAQKMADYCLSVGARLIYVSTMGVLFRKNSGQPRNEDAPYGIPLNLYGRCKMASEEMLKSAQVEKGLEVAIARFPAIYGDAAYTAGWNKILRDAADRKFPLIGSGEFTCRFVHLKDVIGLIERILEKSRFKAEVYHGLSPDRLTFREWFESASRILRGSGQFKRLPEAPLRMACGVVSLIPEALRIGPLANLRSENIDYFTNPHAYEDPFTRAFGYVPVVGIEEGLNELKSGRN
ncbi:NAD(P)-dependent oxidoreductase [bacterium]|nr:NAD(P)-dependent oxidoreductase [bacterium]